MNPFTALKQPSPFHFTFYFLLFFSLILSNLHFTLLCYSYLQFTSRHFILLSPSLPLTGFHFPNPRFENMRFTVGSPYRPFRQKVPVSNGPIHKGVFSGVCSLFSSSYFPMMIDPT